MIMIDGDPYVMSVSTASTRFKSIVVRRITSGTATPTADGPFMVESFDTLAGAKARFAAISSDMLPMMLTCARRRESRDSLEGAGKKTRAGPLIAAPSIANSRIARLPLSMGEEWNGAS